LGTMILITGYFFLPRALRDILDFEYVAWALWFGLSVLVALVIGLRSRHQLLGRFREVAGLGFEVRKSWWQRVLGRG